MGAMVQRTEAGYEAFNARDMETLFAMLTPDFEWHEAAEIPGPKSADREAFVRFMHGFDRLWEEFRFEPLEIVENGDVVYARMRAVGRGRASEERIDFEIHHVWQIRDGDFARMNAYLDEGEAKAAAGLDAVG